MSDSGVNLAKKATLYTKIFLTGILNLVNLALVIVGYVHFQGDYFERPKNAEGRKCVAD